MSGGGTAPPDGGFLERARLELAHGLAAVVERNGGPLEEPPDGRLWVLRVAEAPGGGRSVLLGHAAARDAAEMGGLGEADLLRRAGEAGEAGGAVVVGTFVALDGRSHADVMDFLVVPRARAQA